ncbi:MAG: sirohydrochlorin chelatase [Chloroflexota bacterium]
MKQTVLLIGHGSRDEQATEEYKALAGELAERLQVEVEPCFLEFADPPIVAGIRSCVERGVRDIVALPLFLGPAGHQKNDVPTIINWAKQAWPTIRFRYGVPIGAQHHIAKVLEDRVASVADDGIDLMETAVMVVGRGSRDPDSNAEVAKLARLLFEGSDYGWVETAYFSLTGPRVAETVERCAKLGAKRVIIVPQLLFTGRIYQRMVEQAEAAAIEHNIEVRISHYLYPHPDLVEAIVHRYEETVEGTAKMTCDLCKYRRQMTGFEQEFGMAQQSDHNHGLRGVPHSHGNLDALLPPRYRSKNNGQEVSAAPMGSAPLKLDNEGKVAWDEVWTDFCDLALAGGPPHRSDLLEPIDPQIIQTQPAEYDAVLDELERGIQLVMGRPVLRQTPGWLGIECDDEEMAIWLLRAIIVENVMARREGNTLYFPVSPEYQLEKEIKNVITVIAKTNHYWEEHLLEQQAKPQ